MRKGRAVSLSREANWLFGSRSGLTDALLDLELYFLLVPLVVDEGKEMFSLAHGATDLVIIGGLPR